MFWRSIRISLPCFNPNPASTVSLWSAKHSLSTLQLQKRRTSNFCWHFLQLLPKLEQIIAIFAHEIFQLSGAIISSSWKVFFWAISMEVISSDWIYIAANGRSGAVGLERAYSGEEPGKCLCRQRKRNNTCAHTCTSTRVHPAQSFP